VRIAVADTGCGISEDSLPKVFDRLYQSPNTQESSRKGLGLGLHICRAFGRAAQRQDLVESKEGEGATVFFTVAYSTRTKKASLEFKFLNLCLDRKPGVEHRTRVMKSRERSN